MEGWRAASCWTNYEKRLIIKVMEDQIITEQIDVIVIGDKKYELMSLMLDQ